MQLDLATPASEISGARLKMRRKPVAMFPIALTRHAWGNLIEAS